MLVRQPHGPPVSLYSLNNLTEELELFPKAQTSSLRSLGSGHTLTALIAQAIVAVRARIRSTGNGFRGFLTRILLSNLLFQRTDP